VADGREFLAGGRLTIADLSFLSRWTYWCVCARVCVCVWMCVLTVSIYIRISLLIVLIHPTHTPPHAYTHTYTHPHAYALTHTYSHIRRRSGKVDNIPTTVGDECVRLNKIAENIANHPGVKAYYASLE
jgi:hypothetical protein